MSTSPDNEFDLEKLFLPAWAQEPPSAKYYANYEGREEETERKDRRGRRPQRREGPPGRRDDDRPRGEQRGPRRGEDRKKFSGSERRDFPRREPRERREPPPPLPLPEINVAFTPDEKGVESLARQIKMTGRAYPLFDIARLILQKPERHSVVFGVKKKPDGQPVQPLFVCVLDDTLWLSEDEAVAHVLRKHFATFYQPERTAIEPPKGKYTFVAQCGMSGILLGPPNYHDYQNQLRKLHAERFSRMPFEVYKSRVRIVRDEEVVKKWIDEQSWKTEYVCLNMPEPLRLGSMDQVEKHFREVHKDTIIKSVESHTLSGPATRGMRSAELTRLVRQAWDAQRRFPLQIATSLSQQFAAHGLQFFKVNKTVTHVSVARPHFLDLETTPVSEGVKRIVDYINANPKCTRRKLVETLAPTPTPVAPVESATAGAETTPPPAESSEPTPEQTAVIADLHWLIHQGHVIEFANGTLETAKRPAPRPPKPEEKAVEPTAEAVPTQEPASAGEVVTEESAIATPAPSESDEEAPVTAETEQTAAAVEITPPTAAPVEQEPADSAETPS